MNADSVASSNFRRFWFGQAFSEFGSRIGILGLPVIAVSQFHASSRAVGVLGASSTVCYLLIGLPAGAWVDRMLKRATMMIAAAVRCLVVLAIPILWLTGGLGIGTLYLVAVIVGLASVFFDVAYQSYVPLLVREGDIASANSRLEATAQLSGTGAPALAGLLMQIVSAPVVMLADAIAYFGCLICLTATKDKETKSVSRSQDKNHLIADIAEGLRFVRDQSVIKRIAASMGVSNFFATMVATLVPLLVLRTIGFSAFMLGLIMTCGAAGGVLGALLAPLAAGWLGSAIGVVPTMWIGVVGTTVTVLPIVSIDRLIVAVANRPVGAGVGL